MKNPHKSGVIVIGGHVQGLGVVRIIGQHNIPVILLDDTSYNLARHSRYCKKFYLYNKGMLPEFLKYLSLSADQYRNWLLVPTNDYHVKVLSENYNELSGYYKVSTDKWNVISVCYNKIETYKKAEELGILIPRTFFPSNISDVENVEIAFPCIIKPAVMHEFYDKLKKKVFVCHSKAELKHYYRQAIGIIPADQVIIQEIIPGTSENQYSACFFIQNNRVVSTLTARRKRQHPLDFGNATTFAEIVDRDELRETGERFLKSINYNGICEVEFKRSSADGKYYFLEINPRSWKWHSIAQKANINILMNLYNHHYQLPYFKDSPPDYSVCWQHVMTDTPTRLKQMLKGQYNPSNRTKKQYAVCDRNDMLPTVLEWILLPLLILRR